VFRTEPLPEDSPLWNVDNVHPKPHIPDPKPWTLNSEA
jgi:phosphoglycerate dehydrogenase-like enzyme